MPTNVILARFNTELVYHLVGFYHHEMTEDALNILRLREKTSKSEDVMLNANFFVLDEASYLDFAATASSGKLGWHGRTAWGEIRELDPAYLEHHTETFGFVLSHGLWPLEEHANLFTFEQRVSWDALTMVEGMVFEDEDENHGCLDDGCNAFYNEL